MAVSHLFLYSQRVPSEMGFWKVKLARATVSNFPHIAPPQQQ